MTILEHRLLYVLWISALGIVTGCASLPNVATKIEATPNASTPTEIVSTNGLLSPKHSQAIMERLKRSVDPTDTLQRFNDVIETVTDSPLTKGNKVALLNNGEAAYAAMFKAIDSAKDHINLESFIIDDDAIGRKFSDALLKKQAEGVQVNLIYDSIGSASSSKAFFKRLQDGGIEVVEFSHGSLIFVHPDHRKILIIDGKLAITGGVNISSVYSSKVYRRHEEKEKPAPWRDTDVQIEGPAVAEFQKLFIETWSKQQGPTLAERNYYPKIEESGKALVRVVGSVPGADNRITFIVYVAAITFAERSIYVTNAYFVPDPQLLKALTDAAKRGIDVKIVLPKISDSDFALSAAHYNYTELLTAGVKIFERRDAFLHAKTAVIDGVWSTVGSTNMDYWSLSNNDEVNAIILSHEFASEMERAYAQDLQQSEEITLEKWKKRKFSKRLKEWFTHLFVHWL